MKIVFNNIHIFSTDGEENVLTFSNSVTFIYGNVGAGKSTVLNLIMYAMGGTLIDTPAVKCCLKAVQLEVHFGEKPYKLFRAVNSSRIQIEDVLEKNRFSIPRYQFSAFLYSLFSLPDLYLSIGNISEKKVKLSFSNFCWFSYLKQSEMDSVFFQLDSDSIYKQNAAINVLFSFFESEYVIDQTNNQHYRELKKRVRQYEEGISVFNYIGTLFERESVNDEISGLSVDSLISQIKRASDDSSFYNAKGIKEILALQKRLSQLEYIDSFEKKRKRYDDELNKLRNELQKTENIIGYEQSDNNPHVQKLYDLFLDCLINIGFQGVSKYDIVRMDPKTYMPILINPYENREVSFQNLGSGGKKTIFKTCFALAVHRLQHMKQTCNYLPSFLIIDTPMKNISEREDSIMYDRFYQYLFNLFTTELSDTQLIIVDKEKRDLSGYAFSEDIIMMRMTRDDWMNPPLFRNYKGL